MRRKRGTYHHGVFRWSCRLDWSGWSEFSLIAGRYPHICQSSCDLNKDYWGIEFSASVGACGPLQARVARIKNADCRVHKTRPLHTLFCLASSAAGLGVMHRDLVPVHVACRRMTLRTLPEAAHTNRVKGAKLMRPTALVASRRMTARRRKTPCLMRPTPPQTAFAISKRHRS